MTNSFEKVPSFRNLSPLSEINEVAAHLVVFPNELQAYQSGSCCRIARNLYVTAAHVVKDWIDKFGGPSRQIAFEIWAVHVRNGPEYSIWSVESAWVSSTSDLALLRTRPYNDTAADEKQVKSVALSLFPPKIGERIVGYGHHSPEQSISVGADGTRNIVINAFGAAAVGAVRDVHHERRDSVRLPFPCFQVNARFDGGMSGGPVFNDYGHLCGVICSNLPPTNIAEEHVSYVTTLWPLMGAPINIALDGSATARPHPLIDLAKRGIIKAIGHEQVRVVESEGPEGFRVEI